MKNLHQDVWLWRPAGATVIASLTLPFFLAGCGSPAPPPSPTPVTVSKPGLSGKQKLTLLAGAAAMYYLYRKFQRDNAAQIQKAEAAAPGGKITYYRSKIGGYIYYRDPVTHQAIKVTPPAADVQPQQVNPDEANQYSNFQGYNNASQGETLDKYFPQG